MDELTKSLNQLRALSKQGEDYIWRPAAKAVEIIESQQAELEKLREELAASKAYANSLNTIGEREQKAAFTTIQKLIAQLESQAAGRVPDGRVYTYDKQPCDNVPAWRLGEACRDAAKKPGGDLIDQGLQLLKSLQEKGFGVIVIAAPEPKPTAEGE